MAEILNDYISDDPIIRRLHIVEATLTYCSSVIWPRSEEKQRKAALWAAHIRSTLTHQGFESICHSQANSPCNSLCSSLPRVPAQKRGMNGLSVASADVILSRGPPRGQQEDIAALRSAVSNEDRNALKEPEGGEYGAFPPAFNPSGNGDEPSSDFPLTAATTAGGDVVLVTSTGSPKKESQCISNFPGLPLQVRRLSGGITNELFHVYDEDDPSTSVVVRVFGRETDRVISRESELFYQSLFIKTYVHGTNFLIYAFLDQYETLPYADMPREAGAIAKKLAEFQVKATLAARRDCGKPLLSDVHEHPWRKTEGGVSFENSVGGISSSCPPTSWEPQTCPVPRFDREDNYVMHSLTQWVAQVASGELLGKVQEEKHEEFRRVSQTLCEESVWMKNTLEGHADHLGEGVCHNDLLSGNIMRHTATGELIFVDFDYAKRNYILFDVANHFNEYTGLECDYAKYFPCDEHMSSFIAIYRQAMRQCLEKAHRNLSESAAIPSEKSSSSFKVHEPPVREVIQNERALFWTASEEEEQRTVERWTQLAKLLSLASHLSWSAWALFQEAVSSLDVNFLEYSQLRLARYLEVKDSYAALFTICD